VYGGLHTVPLGLQAQLQPSEHWAAVPPTEMAYAVHASIAAASEQAAPV
jgi:hypothetical protein